MGDHSHCPGRSDDRDAGASLSDPCDPEGKEDGSVLAEGIPVCGIYRSLYRLLQRDHPRGDALGLCFPGGSAAIPFLDVRQSDGADGKAWALDPGTSVLKPVHALCAVHASGGALLPRPVSEPLLLG